MTLSEGILRQKITQPFRYFRRVDSTNDLAKSWLIEGAAEGAVVIADEQARGRGRYGRVWRTPPKAALAISMVLRPPAAQLARINMIGALSVYDLAKQVGCKGIGLKWPNDIQVGGRKIAGILAESVWERDNLRGAVLGIGVNVRIDFSHTELRDAAASLEEVAGVPLDRAELIRVLLERISVWYERSASDEVFDTWKSRLSMLGKPVIAEGVSGIALDVTDSGALLVEDDLGVRHIVIAGEVTTGGVLRSAE